MESALENSLVLHKIFGYLDEASLKAASKVSQLWYTEANKFLQYYLFFRHLKNQKRFLELQSCRLVCKKWRRIVDEVLRSTMQPIVLKTHEQLSSYNAAFVTRDSSIFREFHLFLHDIDTNNITSLSEFSTKFGIYVTKLSLYNCAWTFDLLRKVLFEDMLNLEEISINVFKYSIFVGRLFACALQKSSPIGALEIERLVPKKIKPRFLPSLKSFRIDGIQIFHEISVNTSHTFSSECGSKCSGPELREFFEDMFTSALNLENIHIGYDQCLEAHREHVCCSAEITHWYLHNALVHPDVQLSNLQQVKTPQNHFYSSSDLLQLQLKYFPLREFSIDVPHSQEKLSSEEFYSFIWSLRGTLEELTIRFIDFRSSHEKSSSMVAVDSYFPVPANCEFSKLKYLSIYRASYYDYRFLSAMPELKELHLLELEADNVKVVSCYLVTIGLIDKLEKVNIRQRTTS